MEHSEISRSDIQTARARAERLSFERGARVGIYAIGGCYLLVRFERGQEVPDELAVKLVGKVERS